MGPSLHPFSVLLFFTLLGTFLVFSHHIYPSSPRYISRNGATCHSIPNAPARNSGFPAPCMLATDNPRGSLLRRNYDCINYPFGSKLASKSSYRPLQKCCYCTPPHPSVVSTLDFSAKNDTLSSHKLYQGHIAPLQEYNGKSQTLGAQNVDTAESDVMQVCVDEPVLSTDATPSFKIPRRKFTISDVDLGIVKDVTAPRAFDVAEYMQNDGKYKGGTKRYDEYTIAAVSRLFSELESSGFSDLLHALESKYAKSSDAVQLSKGYRCLLLEYYHTREYEKLLNTFFDLVKSPFLLDIEAFHLAILSTRDHTVVLDGWLLSYFILNKIYIYGVKYFIKEYIFKNINDCCKLSSDIPLDEKDKIVHFNSKAEQRARYDKIRQTIDDALYSFVSARRFDLFIYHYLLKQGNESVFSKDADPNSSSAAALLDLPPPNQIQIKTPSTSANDSNSLNVEKRLQEMLEDMDPAVVMTCNFDSGNIAADIKSLNASNMDYSQVARSLVLRHVMYAYTKNTQVLYNWNADSKLDTLLDVSGKLEGCKDINTYAQMLCLRRFFKPASGLGKCSTEHFMSFVKNGGADVSDSSKLANFLSAPIGETFLKSSSSSKDSVAAKLKQTFSLLRGASKGRSFAVLDIYKYMLQFLNADGISGSVAANLMFLLVPWLRFKSWAHYHVYLLAFEADSERCNLDSMDQLLQMMSFLGCKPDPSMYARFFSLCNARKRFDVILRHCHLFLQDNSNPLETIGDYDCSTRNTLSFDMYYNALLACKETESHGLGMNLFRRLLLDLGGLYKYIPYRIWALVNNMALELNLNVKLIALVEQCKYACSKTIIAPDVKVIKRDVKNPHYSVIAREMDSLIAKGLPKI